MPELDPTPADRVTRTAEEPEREADPADGEQSTASTSRQAAATGTQQTNSEDGTDEGWVQV